MVKSCQIIAVALLIILSSAPAKAIELLFPVACRIMTDCWITNHVDLNKNTGQIEDYMCGQKSDDNSMSTHISLASRMDVGRNIAVIAAADGIVQVAGNVGGFCGTRVLIDHGGGWETSYCHLNPETIQVRQDQMIKRGQVLGSIGMSGQSDWPHLSFALLRNGMAFDPFSGRTNLEGCNQKSRALWVGGMNPLYEPAHVTNIGFTVGNLTNAQISNGKVAKATIITTATPQLTLWGMLMNVKQGDRIDLKVETPSGRILNEAEKIADRNRDYFPLTFMTSRKNFLWDAGPYRGSITITRRINGNEITTGKFTTVLLVEQNN